MKFSASPLTLLGLPSHSKAGDSFLHRTCAELLNEQIAEAQTTFLAWCGNQQEIIPGAIESALRSLERHPEWLMVFGDIQPVECNGAEGEPFASLPLTGIFSDFRHHQYVPDPLVIWRYSMSRLLGPLNTNLQVAYGLEYWLRAFEAFPFRIGYIPCVFTRCVRHTEPEAAQDQQAFALEATKLLAARFRSAPKDLLDRYATDLHLGHCRLPDGTSIAEHLHSTLELARPHLSPDSLRQLETDWLLDPELAPMQERCERIARELALPSLNSIQLLQIVHPELSYSPGGPPAGPATRLLRFLLRTGFSRYRILREDVELINRINHAEAGPALNLPALLHRIDILRFQSKESLAIPSIGAEPGVLCSHLSKAFPGVYFFRNGAICPNPRPSTGQQAFHRRPFGVNLIGHAYNCFGIGEDVRMAARALKEAAVPFCVIDHPAQNGSATKDRSLEPNTLPLGVPGPFAFNLVCLAAPIHARWVCTSGLSQQWDHYTIAAWPWETERWPVAWNPILELADECWPSSHLIETALKTSEANKSPIQYMPMAVEIGDPVRYTSVETRRQSRHRFGLPSDTILFVYAFDLNSRIERKNPKATIEAFQQAFGDHDSVGLVIKTFPTSGPNTRWAELRKRISADRRLHLIESNLDRQELLLLYGCCDCFLSLHRSEGFGRGLAEALQLGLDVIATDFGGNTDFCEGVLSHPVNYRMVPIPAGSYPHHENQVWAEPDLSHAVEQMRAVAIRRRNGPGNGLGVMASFLQRFSPGVVGRRYRDRLEALWSHRDEIEAGLRWRSVSGRKPAIPP